VLRAIGVPELRALFAGETDVVEAAAAGALATRQYAKRQYTWFRRQPPPDWERSSATETKVLLAIIETKFLI
jgi:tRNA dimethylallyltransferase